MSVTLKAADRILKTAYVDLVNRELKNNKEKGKYESLRCRQCGRSGVTLRKCSDGQYICDDCMKKK